MHTFGLNSESLSHRSLHFKYFSVFLMNLPRHTILSSVVLNCAIECVRVVLIYEIQLVTTVVPLVKQSNILVVGGSLHAVGYCVVSPNIFIAHCSEEVVLADHINITVELGHSFNPLHVLSGKSNSTCVFCST